MASPSTFVTLHLFFIIFTLFSLHVQPKRVISEDGYTITTVLDGHKLHINPFSVLQRPTSSDLIVLDSTNSTFYTVQLPISQESVFKRFSGNGSPGGYEDGDVGSARFDKPRSFAVDTRGNVYVADRLNKVIRKIGINGVTTIAGGSSEKTNIKDGPAQNASFSNDFEITFIPSLCALLVSDHMHQLVCQINLKEEDCTLGSKSGLGAVMTWTLGLGLSCILGLIIGIVVRPYIIPHEHTSRYHFIATWKHCQTSPGKIVLTVYSGLKSAVASCSCSSIFALALRLWKLSLSLLVLMFNIDFVSPRRPHLESVSLLDLDAYNSGEISKSSKYFDQLKDLMNFDEDLVDSTKDNKGRKAPKGGNILHQDSSVSNLGIVKRI
ncbi:hypothetical protein L195_g006930 [Trifolium pratense]|uniref:Uncharacterized protein n=2 Tax=Trifolium pratense TaxID=57577 RepID=A0ACB0JJV9_TRIPR|nr:hypothetical protein L195_g006930 [Trifolium pratense]CAJ2645010.1 unnamed protein product [Trifolium pratense]